MATGVLLIDLSITSGSSTPPSVMVAKEKYILERRHVMRIDGDLVIAYNTDRPFPSQVDPYSTPRLRHLHLPAYESKEFPYLCAAPAVPDYSGAILGRLSQTIEQYPLVQTGSRYSLDPTVASRWQSLERALKGVALCLLEHSGEPLVPLEYKFPPPPYLQGYLDSYSSSNAARTAIQRSRDAFQALIAHASWAAILHRLLTFWSLYTPGVDLDVMLDKSWVETLQYKCRIHPAWLWELRMSAICDFRIRRAGLVLRKPNDWYYSSKLLALIVSNVPVWIIWGKGPYDTCPSTWTLDLAKTFGPSQKESSEAQVWITPKPATPPKPATTLPPAVTTDQSCANTSKQVRFAETTKDSTTCIHEDVHAWIKKKEVLIAEALANADQLKRTKWMQRQEAAKSFQCPGTRGAFVYEWDRDENQRPVRARVNRANVEQAWSMFADTQRWYNCVENVWELCHELDPSAITFDVEDDFDVTTSEYEMHDEDVLGGWLSGSAIDAETAELDLMTNSFKPEDLAGQKRRDSGGVVLEAFDLISLRFGYACVNGSKYESMEKPPIKLQKALRVIGDGFDTPVYTMLDGAEASFIQYVMYLDAVGHPNIDIDQVPSALCDLYPENPSFLGNQTSTVVVHQAVHMETTLYIIRHRNEDIGNDWVLAVKDPCTAAQCIRSRPLSLMEIIRDLIDTKTAFYTLRPLPDSTCDSKGRSLRKSDVFTGNRIGLGVRPIGHVLDLTDYIAYESVKMKLLQDKRIARAVVKRGGIISRLAEGLVDEYDVISGPTWNADGKCIRVSIMLDGQKREYFDDDVSLEELATFVGLYSFKGKNFYVLRSQIWST